MSEGMRGALNAILFRTGDQSRDFAVVLATNRPGALPCRALSQGHGWGRAVRWERRHMTAGSPVSPPRPPSQGQDHPLMDDAPSIRHVATNTAVV